MAVPYRPWVAQGPPALEAEPQPPPQDRIKLRFFGIPQAGMGGWAFHGWTRWMPPEVEMMPVELPGRGARMREPKQESAGELARQCIEALLPLMREKPFAIFGHSMGAWLVYEMVHELRRREEAMPLKVYFSGMRAPHLYGPSQDPDQIAPTLHDLPSEEFWAHFERRYGKNPDLTNQGIKEFVLPLLRSDFKVSETYELPADVAADASYLALPVPMAALGAEGDDRHTKEQLAAWAVHTSVSFNEAWFEGKGSVDPDYWGTPHRYAIDNPQPLVEWLACDLRAAMMEVERGS
eukprot:CAMPEP_0117575876 /NCGR_PEP_ID=MMETSP0784-20121206/62468_1 /TAXON_ID=39447 /ORGANISM="" /LENGTH=292 /DNA_ID=CAMNT_0005375031 /DNA_START=32 /DNA_END=910 /DNA_ORIENTATION=-